MDAIEKTSAVCVGRSVVRVNDGDFHDITSTDFLTDGRELVRKLKTDIYYLEESPYNLEKVCQMTWQYCKYLQDKNPSRAEEVRDLCGELVALEKELAVTQALSQKLPEQVMRVAITALSQSNKAEALKLIQACS